MNFVSNTCRHRSPSMQWKFTACAHKHARGFGDHYDTFISNDYFETNIRIIFVVKQHFFSFPWMCAHDSRTSRRLGVLNFRQDPSVSISMWEMCVLRVGLGSCTYLLFRVFREIECSSSSGNTHVHIIVSHNVHVWRSLLLDTSSYLIARACTCTEEPFR